jgi:PAT family beta-lactamase induction signal transducer AmpG
MLMYGANIFETSIAGMGTGAFFVFLMRITQKRFSATQYALFSSLFGIPRIVSGPIAGFTVSAVGWEWFYWGTIFAGIPGLLLLQRFSPLGTRDPIFTVEPSHGRPPLKARAIGVRGVAGGLAGLILGAVCLAGLDGLKALRADPTASFDLAGRLAVLTQPQNAGGWLGLAGLLVFAAFIGLCTAAVSAAGSAERTETGEVR